MANLEMTKAGDELVAIDYNRFDGLDTYRFKTVIRTTKTLIIFDESGTPVVRKTGHFQGHGYSTSRQTWQPATPEHHEQSVANEAHRANIRLVSESLSSWDKCRHLDKALLAQIANLLRGAAQ